MTSAAPLLLLGGTFDPPHIGHLVLGECGRAQFGASRVLFLPAGLQYRKGHEHSSAEDRLTMLRLAVAGNPAFAIDERELRRPGPTYTVETLEEIRGETIAPLVLVLGHDALADLPAWKDPQRIRELATIAVAPRGEAAGRLEDGIVEIAMPPLAVSSSLIRERVRDGLPIRYLVPDAVEEHMRRRGLYHSTV
jgi:nicotinate-nucleotide adenylyltransferase